MFFLARANLVWAFLLLHTKWLGTDLERALGSLFYNLCATYY